MTSTAALLLLLSALLHALWNYRSKKVSPSPASLSLPVCFAGPLIAPELFWLQQAVSVIDQKTFWLLLLSCIF